MNADTEVHLRPATSGDLPRLLELMRGYYAHDRIEFDAAAARTALGGPLGDGNIGRVWLIERGGREVGYVVALFGWSLEFHGRDAFLDELFIEPEARGRGAGTRALQLALAELEALGVRAVHLEVERSNEGAQRFYAALGFGRRERFLLMSRRLGRNAG